MHELNLHSWRHAMRMHQAAPQLHSQQKWEHCRVPTSADLPPAAWEGSPGVLCMQASPSGSCREPSPMHGATAVLLRPAAHMLPALQASVTCWNCLSFLQPARLLCFKDLLELLVLLEDCFVTSVLQGDTGAMPRLLALTRARVMYCLQNHAALDVAAVVSDELSLLAELAAASSSAAAGQSCCRVEHNWSHQGRLPPETVHAGRYPRLRPRSETVSWSLCL